MAPTDETPADEIPADEIPADEISADDLGLGWCVPLNEPPPDPPTTPRIWADPGEPAAGEAGPPFRARPEDSPPPNGSFFHLRGRGDAA